MGFPLGYGFKRSALRQHLSFTFKVDLCVDVGGVDGDVPHPGANGVDVDARAQEMGSGCMTDGVRADSFPQQRRTLERCFSNMSLQQRVNTGTGQWLTEPVEEYRLIGRPVSDEDEQPLGCGCPERTPACFPTFTEQRYGTHGTGMEIQICDG